MDERSELVILYSRYEPMIVHINMSQFSRQSSLYLINSASSSGVWDLFSHSFGNYNNAIFD